MRKILAIGLAALAAACGSEDKQEPIRYGAPEAATWEEADAAALAASTFETSVLFQAPTDPTAGAAGLGDQIAGSLAGYPDAKAPGAWAAKAAGAAVNGMLAFETGEMDPACMSSETVGDVTTMSWTACQIDASDPTMTMHVEIDGWISHDAASGRTWWDVGERLAMTMTLDTETMTMSGTAGLRGSMTVDTSASTIEASTVSFADVTVDYMGMRIRETPVTTLEADLTYQAAPFCITGGWLRVEHRPGAPMGGMPNQGWYFEWTGCDAFTVAQGG